MCALSASGVRGGATVAFDEIGDMDILPIDACCGAGVKGDVLNSCDGETEGTGVAKTG